jgi:hypothetical protein
MNKTVLITAVLGGCLTIGADDFASQFASPPVQYGPSCFWWWFGAPYSTADVRSSLDAMKAAGLGGFRIYPVYAFPNARLPDGVHNAPYLSPEFIELTGEAVQYGRAIGLTPEVFPTSGWPYGGPWIRPELGAGQLKYYSREVHGPAKFRDHVPGEWPAPERVLAVEAAQLSSSDGIDLGTVVNLTGNVSGAGSLDWDVPAGRWVLMTFVSGYTGMTVKRAAPGGEGLVLDHLNRDALAVHLRAAGDTQRAALSGALAVGVDSWEVYNSNWTTKLPEEFEHRRGYSLIPYLPAIFLPGGDTGARVRYDFRRTVSELVLENFYAPLAGWAHGRALKLRTQAHGTPADIIEAYGAADFPEGETYGPEDRHNIQIRDRKFASSAAHLFGLNQVSAESFTWLRFPMFRVTLEQMKAAADAIYLDGINQVNYHGVPFSPAWADPPGFFFYASTFVSPGNTWWPHLEHLSAYLRRANFLLQQGDPVADIAVYGPYEDVWSDAFGTRFDLAGSIEKRMTENGTASMLRSLRDAGFDFDFINARRLAAARVEDGRLAIGPRAYRVVLLPSIESIDPDALERVRDFCRRGGIVVAVDRAPRRSPGLRNHVAESARVRAIASELFGSADVGARRVGAGTAVFVPSDPARSVSPPQHPAVRVISSLVEPDFVFEGRDESVGFIHRRSGRRDMYFVANISPVRKTLRAHFRASARNARMFDPENGTECRVGLLGHDRIELTLDPFGSAFVVFGGVSASGIAGTSSAPQQLTMLPVAGPWTLSRPGVNPVRLDRLDSWTELVGWRDFSGSATYETTFELPPSLMTPGISVMLDLGEVQDIADVVINGVRAGIAWKHPYVVDISRGISAGHNQITVYVTNRLLNWMLAHEPHLPSPYYNLRNYETTPEPSGLRGPVELRLAAR